MKTSIEHLPESKQQQILAIVEIIKEVATPEKIILYGSYATGEWAVDNYVENGVKYGFRSDYDFLVVTNKANEKDYVLQDKIINRSRSLFQTPVTPIIHDIDYVNEGLEIGQYFFTDIIKEGILLFDAGTVNFAEPRLLSNEEMKKISQRYFKQWFNAGAEFIIGAELYFNRNQLNMGAFMLHQAAERFYNTILLVFTGYKPKTHNLDKLRTYAKQLSQQLSSIFPVDNKTENHLFDLLKRGYIEARYDENYFITKDELKELIKRIEKMKELIDKICLEKIASFDE